MCAALLDYVCVSERSGAKTKVPTAWHPRLAERVVSEPRQGIGPLIRRRNVLSADHDVDDRLGQEARHGRAADVFDRAGRNTEARRNAILLVSKLSRPLRLMGLQMNRFIEHHDLSG